MGSRPAQPRIVSWRLLILTLVTIVVLWLLATRVTDAGSLFETLAGGDPAALALAAGLMGAGIFLATLRLRFVLRAMGYDVPVQLVFRAILSTWPLSVVAPSRLNEFLRAVVLRKHVPVVEGAGAVLAERVVDVQTLCLLAVVGGALSRTWSLAFLSGLGFVGVWGGAIALAVVPDWFAGLPLIRRKSDKVRQLVTSFESLRNNVGTLAAVMACSLGVWLVAVCIIFVLLGAFGAQTNFGTALALWPLAVFAGLLPVTLSGMGTRDAAFLTLLSLTGHLVNEDSVLSATITYAIVTTILPGLLGVPWMIQQMSLLRAGTDEQ